MKRLRRAGLLFLALVLAALVASSTSCVPGGEATGRVEVAVTIPPQAEIVESIGGDRVATTVMVPPGASPHTYEPIPSQLATLSRAEMYAKVGSGIDFELVWMDRLIAANRDMLVVDCARGIALAEDGDEHEGIDPHIWMSPPNAGIMAGNICDGLSRVDPGGRDYYQQNRDAYQKKLTELDREIRDGLSEVANRRFMVYHPAFGYFAREYNLTMIPIEEEGKEPTAAGIAHLIEQAREHNIKVIFASPQFNPQSARVIADAIGGRVVFIDPLEREYLASLRTLRDELVAAME